MWKQGCIPTLLFNFFDSGWLNLYAPSVSMQQPSSQLTSTTQPRLWQLDLSRTQAPTTLQTLALPEQQVSQLVTQHQEKTRALAEQLLEDSTVQRAIQVWREDLLTKQSHLKSVLQDILKTILTRIPLFQKARASYLQLKHRDLNWCETLLTAVKILSPPLLLLLLVWYGATPMSQIFHTATQFSVNPKPPAALAAELQSLCPAGFIPTPKTPQILQPSSLKPTLQDYTCRELKCPLGSTLKGSSCFAVNCIDTNTIYDGSWGFCVPRQRTVPGFLWGESNCAAKLGWISLFDLACWVSYLKLLLPWSATALISTTQWVAQLTAALVAALLLLSFLRISVSAASIYYAKYRAASLLARFIQDAEAIALKNLEYRVFQIITPFMFQHLDALQGMPPVQRAIVVAEYGFSDESARENPIHTLRPLYLKCIQDVISSMNERSLLALVEADLVEDRAFHTLIQWIENTSNEFRDEVGRIRSQRALLSFQDDVRSACTALRSASSFAFPRAAT